MTTWLVIATVVGLIAAVLASLAWLGVGWLGAWRLNAPPSASPEKSFTFTPWELEVDHEAVVFTTSDGIRLRGWFLPRPGDRRVIIAMHGYRGNKAQLLGISCALWRAGHNVLLFDFRGRGESESAPISMGLWEVADLAAAIEEVTRRVPEPSIGLLGYSMGGTVALLGGADPRVAAIAIDSAFPSQRGVLEHVAARDIGRVSRGRLRGQRFLPAVEFWHRRRGKPDFDAISVESAMQDLEGTPLLVIHGTRDGMVPVALAERLVDSAPGTPDTWFVNGAYHCGAYFVDREAYCTRVTAFFRRHLTAGQTAEMAVQPGQRSRRVPRTRARRSS